MTKIELSDKQLEELQTAELLDLRRRNKALETRAMRAETKVEKYKREFTLTKERRQEIRNAAEILIELLNETFRWEE
jgi:hypothetical protein